MTSSEGEDDNEIENEKEILQQQDEYLEQEQDLFVEQFDIVKFAQLIKQNQNNEQSIQKKKIKPKLPTTKLKSKSISPQKKKKQKPKPKVKDLKPINLEIQKNNFFLQKCAYNPQFEYTDNAIELFQEQPHRKYEDIALKILEACIKQYGSETNYAEMEGGQIITQEETEQFFLDYINKLGVQHLITHEFQANTVAPTSVVHNPVEGKSKVIFGLPIQYRINRIEGVLNHEIGTHFIRKINDKSQCWFKRRYLFMLYLLKQFHLQPYLKHEEGLAVLNQTLASVNKGKRPFLFMAALHYISAILSSKLSFAQLYHELRYFIQDENKRFRECLRVKRGMRDTSLAGGMYKDQVYLKGAIRILKMRNKLNFIHFHCGKLTAKDCIRLSENNMINTQNMQQQLLYLQRYLPLFLQDIDTYKQGLNTIANINFII